MLLEVLRCFKKSSDQPLLISSPSYHHSFSSAYTNLQGTVWNDAVFEIHIKFLIRLAFHRYAGGDRVESWLHEVLCLDAAEQLPAPPPRLPHPDECELYYVERDTLFSYHKVLPPKFLNAS